MVFGALGAPALAACFGLLWGSFVGVLVDRIPRGADVVRGRSRCDACDATLGAVDLVPVISWLALRGRCRHCGAKVPARWTLIEGATALLFVLAEVAAPDTWSAIGLAPFLGVLLALTLIDVATRRLPNAIVYPTAVVAAVWVVLGVPVGSALDVGGAAIGALAFGGSLLLVTIASRGGMGLGDVKLAGVIGLVVGALDLPSVGVAAGAAIAFGGVAAIVALLRGADRRSALPFGPMLAAGALVAVAAGPRIADAYIGLFS
ncbi:MAG: prepilin peptidase [Actinomycetota bacterium]